MLSLTSALLLLSVAALSRANPAWLVETDLPWEQVSPLPANRIEHTHFVHDGYVYLLGKALAEKAPKRDLSASSSKADGHHI
jgi:hypothetical protein